MASSPFASKEAELCAYMEYNGWGMEDVVALNMLHKRRFTSEEAAQLLLVSRRTGQNIEHVMSMVILARMHVSTTKLAEALRRMQ